jgi:hypothetical protein
MITPPTKITVPVGGLWDDPDWQVQFDYVLDHIEDCDRIKPCPHALHVTASSHGWMEWQVPRVVVAHNQCGLDSTGVCLDCIIDWARGQQ